MGINFGSVISNSKSAANIAKLKMTLRTKNEELNRLYKELGKRIYEGTKCDPPHAESDHDPQCASPDANSGNAAPRDARTAFIELMEQEEIQLCLKNIQALEQGIAALEAQVSEEKGNMKPIETPREPMPDAYPYGMQPGYYGAPAPQAPPEAFESGVRCPGCGALQSPDNMFCENCGTKMNE